MKAKTRRNLDQYEFTVRPLYAWAGSMPSRLLVSSSPGTGDIMEETTVSHTLQLGNIQVDEAQLRDLCRRYGVGELSVFGSAARGEMHPDSDIDLLVEFLPQAKVDLVDHAGLMLDLAQLLGRKVDLVSKKALKPLIRASVLAEAQLLYAA